jgi:hypothetical protein
MTMENRVDLNTRVARSEEVLTSEVDGEVVMMSIEQWTCSGLDGIGSEIWRLMDSPLTDSGMRLMGKVKRDVYEKIIHGPR